MSKIALGLYLFVDGVNDTPFPSASNQAKLTGWQYNAKRMAGAPSITGGTITYASCLDGDWNDNIYVEYKGEKFFAPHKPTSSYSSLSVMYEHKVDFLSERAILDNVYFYDVVSEQDSDGKPISNSNKFTFFGTIAEFIVRLNASMAKSQTGYSAVLDPNQENTSIEKQLKFEAKYISEAMQEGFKAFGIPYYFVGKVAHFGDSQASALDNIIFEYGDDKSLISINKTNANNRLVNRITGTGSSENIPYYYPNSCEKGIAEIGNLSSSTITSIDVVDDVLFAKKVSKDAVLRYGEWYVPLNIPSFYVDGEAYLNQHAFLGEELSNKTIHVVVPFDIEVGGASNLELAFLININGHPSNLLVSPSIAGSSLLYSDDPAIVVLSANNAVGIGKYQLSFDVTFGEISQGSKVTFGVNRAKVLAQTWKDTSNGKYYYDLSKIGLHVNGTPSLNDSFKQKIETLIPYQKSLMPSIYRNSRGEESFYNADNNTYINPATGEYYSFENPYAQGKAKEYIQDNKDIKPSIKGMVNASSEPIDQIIKFAFDEHDSDEIDEQGKYVHPYFFALLHKTDGSYGFNLFDHASDEGEMSLSMTSGKLGGCEFIIGVGEESQQNTVQIELDANLEPLLDEDGHPILKRDANGDVLYGLEGRQPSQVPQSWQNDTINNEVWVALKKEEATYGIIMPNASSNYRPDNDDDNRFVILHIDLPRAYTFAAEQALENYLIASMSGLNSEHWNFGIDYSRIYLKENPNVESVLDENKKIKVRYNGVVYSRYILSFSYRTLANEIYPSINVELAESLEASSSPIDSQIDAVKDLVAIQANAIIGYQQIARLARLALPSSNVNNAGSPTLPIYFEGDKAKEINALEVPNDIISHRNIQAYGGVAARGIPNLGMGAGGGQGDVTSIQFDSTIPYQTANPYTAVDGLLRLPVYPSLAGMASQEWVAANFAGIGYESRVDAIEALIPSQATSLNQLADKAFVNSSIATATATYQGSYNLVSDLSLTTSATREQIASALASAIVGEDNNDYAFVEIPTSDSTPTQIASVERYKYNGTSWVYEYTLNNSGMTAAQWAALNSGITASGVALIYSAIQGVKVNGTLLTPDSNQIVNVGVPTALSQLSDDASHRLVTDTQITAWGAKYDLPSGGIPKTDLASDVQTSLGLADTALQSVRTLTIQKNGTTIDTFDPTASANKTINISDVASASTLNSHINNTNNPHSVTKAQVGLGNVENTALSTWAGSGYITTLGTIATGVWHGSAIADTYISSATAWNAKYDKPSGGIPKTDLAQGVQDSLGLADTALQSHQTIYNLIIKKNGTQVGSTYNPATAAQTIDITDVASASALSGVSGRVGNLEGYFTSGVANNAARLSNTTKIGDTNQPVYFTANGVPAVISYTIGRNVAANEDVTPYTPATNGNISVNNHTIGISMTVTPDPTSSGTDISFIASVSQDSYGKISATKKAVRAASASQSGIVNTLAQTFAGDKTFNGNVQSMKGIAAHGIANLAINAGGGSGDVTSIKFGNGSLISASDGLLAVPVGQGTSNGQINIGGQDVSVKGLGTFAYISSLAFADLTNKPTTLSGYGITDAKIANGVITLGSNTITPLTSHQTLYNLVINNSVGTAQITYKPGVSGTYALTLTKAMVGLSNVGNFLAVSTVASQGLTDTQKANARANIGAGTSNFTGYTSSNKLSTNYIQNDAGWTAVTDSTIAGWGYIKSYVNTAKLQISDTTAKKINTAESTGNYLQFVGGTNKFSITDGTNTFDVPVTPSVTFPVTSVVGQTGAVTTAQVATALTNAGYKLTDTNTKVTSAANHYTPESVAYTPTAGSWSWNSTTVVTGITKDDKGHIVGITTTKIANPNTDHYAWADITDKPATATRWPSWSEVTDKPGTFYTLPIASASVLGGIKVGANLSINSSTGVLSATDTTYTNGTGLSLSGTTFSISQANVSTILNLLSEGASPATRDDYIIAQYAGGGTTTTSYHRRKLSKVFAALNSSDVTTALGYTPFNSANFTKANIKSTLEISDWALASTKPSYAFSEITGSVANSQLANSYIGIGNRQINLGSVLELSVLADDLALGSAASYAATNAVTKNSGALVTSGAVWSAIDALPEPMVFRGSLGTGGTITALPVNGTAKIGDTYKVITAGTYASKAAKVGDTFICLTKTASANTWELIPSGDEPSGTVTSVAMSVPTGLSVSGSPITSSGTFAITYASGYAIPTTAKQSNWDTAYGWGNHASAGYVKTVKVGNDSYSPTNGVVSLPAYPYAVSELVNDLGFTANTGTVTSVTIKGSGAIVVDYETAITGIGTRTISHANSGATAGSYGDSAAQTPAYGGTFKVPYVTVDAQGHVTAISEHTVKIPASDNTWRPLGTGANDACAGNDSRLSDARTPVAHASSATTYGVGTTSLYGHVKLATGDMNGATGSDGVAVGKNHTHSQYALAANLGTASTHAHGDYVTAITYDSTNRKLQQSKGGGTATDIVQFGTNAFNSTAYLPLSGGTMTGNISMGKNSIKFNVTPDSDWNIGVGTSETHLRILNTVGADATGAPSDYAVGLSVKGYYGFQIASFGGDSDNFLIRNIRNGLSEPRAWVTLYHSGNSNRSTVDWATKKLTASDQIVSNVATGTAPLSIASTTLVSNLNAEYLGGTKKADLFSALTNDNDQLSATIGGTNKKVTVGYASRSTDTRTELLTEQEFIYRQTAGGGLTYKPSSAVVKRVLGNTVVWNQLIKITTSTTSAAGVTGTLNSDNSITLNGTATSDSYLSFNFSQIYLEAGHKVFFYCTGKLNAQIPSNKTAAFVSGETGNIVTISTSGSELQIWIRFSNGASFSNKKINVYLVDLTLFFNGNIPEGLTAETFERDYGYLLANPEYNAGTIINNAANGLETVGFNLWDEKWEVGVINGDSGENENNNEYIRSKNYIPIFSSQSYYFKKTYSQYAYVMYYDKEKRYLGRTTRQYFSKNTYGGTLSIPTNCGYIRFINGGDTGGNAYNNDICINLSDPNRNGTYEPYKKTTFPLNLKENKVKSHNIWDEEWELGRIDLNSGVNVPLTTQIRAKNYIPIIGGQYYCASSPNSATFGVYVIYYDVEKNPIVPASADNYKNEAHQAPINARFARFYCSQGYGATYNHDICINESSSFNGKYEPHGILTINGLKSAGSVRDERVGKMFIRRVGTVDLGTLSFTLHGTSPNLFQSTLPLKKVITGGWRVGGVCAKYNISPTSNSTETPDKTFSYGWQTTALFIRDSSYSAAAAFKTAMSGVMLNYELATPIEYEIIDEAPYEYPIDTLGTERIVSDELVAPFVADIQYGAEQRNVAYDINSLHSNALALKGRASVLESYFTNGIANNAARLSNTSAIGSTTKPVYFTANGVPAECSTYGGGTAVTLNGSSKAASTASFYAPTAAGISGQILKSTAGTPEWINQSAITAGALTTVSKTAWGRTYWTSGGVPDNISGDMSNVGNIAFQASGKNIGGIAYFDTTNSRLGIGTSSPSFKLEVYGDIYASNGWIRTNGSRGWYSETYGGGWYCDDYTYVKTYGNRSIYTAADVLAGGNIVGTKGVASQGIANLSVAAISGSNFVTQVKIGSTAYNPSDGVVSLPAYPTVPTALSGFTNDVGYITNVTGNQITNALGYVPARKQASTETVTGNIYDAGSKAEVYDVWTPTGTTATFKLPYDPALDIVNYVLVVNNLSSDITVSFVPQVGTAHIIAPSNSLVVPAGKAIEVSYLTQLISSTETVVLSWSSAFSQYTIQ